MNPFFAIIAAAVISFGAAQALGCFGDHAPSVGAPFPIPLVVLAFFGIPLALLAFFPAVAFVAWQPSMLVNYHNKSVVPLPLRTWVFLTGVSIFSLTWFFIGWDYGVRYEGADFVRNCAWISAGFATASTILCAFATWSQNSFANLIAHTMLFYWTATYAFPYLGELP